jgi:hypothetical protein
MEETTTAAQAHATTYARTRHRLHDRRREKSSLFGRRRMRVVIVVVDHMVINNNRPRLALLTGKEFELWTPRSWPLKHRALIAQRKYIYPRIMRNEGPRCIHDRPVGNDRIRRARLS